ncbi:hypothetical protein AVEN_238217-1 [Araneus ventricosus]|uniref:Uncharacterized protein n=1 Tax=Araneus ventricosus TaxID=182803 RepID=A0A4Y2I531_ARAVE|nr:hypothetical protein AVEN_238217-1 [Araneus ventricosus]
MVAKIRGPGMAAARHSMLTPVKLPPNSLVVRKSRNHPTVEIDHWGDRCLVVGRMESWLSSGKKGRRSSIPSGTNKKGVLDITERRAVKKRLGSLERGSDFGSAEKSCVTRSD